MSGASWLWPLGAALVASGATLLGSGLILLLGKRAESAAVWLLSYAVGTLLGAATLRLLPEALHQASVELVMPLFLAGMVIFIVIERALRWRHPHQAHPDEPRHPQVERATATMLLWGDAVHNFVDGLVIGASFRVSAEVGIAVAIAIFAHELPQEIGDFAILIGSGMSRGKALLLNYLSSVAVLPGAALSFAWSSAPAQLGWLLPIAAGGFVYIALADLVPALHHRRGTRAGFVQLLLLAVGVVTIWALSDHHH